MILSTLNPCFNACALWKARSLFLYNAIKFLNFPKSIIYLFFYLFCCCSEMDVSPKWMLFLCIYKNFKSFQNIHTRKYFISTNKSMILKYDFIQFLWIKNIGVNCAIYISTYCNGRITRSNKRFTSEFIELFISFYF